MTRPLSVSEAARSAKLSSGVSGKLSEGASGLPCRARERALAEGSASRLADAELIALLLGTGTRKRSVQALASDLLQHAGGLRRLLSLELGQLTRLPGLGEARATRLAAVLELARRAAREPEQRPVLKGPEACFRYLEPGLGALPREEFHVLCLNTRNVLLLDARVAQGGPSSCQVDPREVFAPALTVRSSAVVLAHNHPSGDPEPSVEDVHLTHQLAKAGATLAVAVLDHLVIGAGRYVSLLERGVLTPQRSRSR